MTEPFILQNIIVCIYDIQLILTAKLLLLMMQSTTVNEILCPGSFMIFHEKS
jgi:hypothetical protein